MDVTLQQTQNGWEAPRGLPGAACAGCTLRTTEPQRVLRAPGAHRTPLGAAAAAPPAGRSRPGSALPAHAARPVRVRALRPRHSARPAARPQLAGRGEAGDQRPRFSFRGDKICGRNTRRRWSRAAVPQRPAGFCPQGDRAPRAVFLKLHYCRWPRSLPAPGARSPVSPGSPPQHPAVPAGPAAAPAELRCAAAPGQARPRQRRLSRRSRAARCRPREGGGGELLPPPREPLSTPPPAVRCPPSPLSAGAGEQRGLGQREGRGRRPAHLPAGARRHFRAPSPGAGGLREAGGPDAAERRNGSLGRYWAARAWRSSGHGSVLGTELHGDRERLPQGARAGGTRCPRGRPRHGVGRGRGGGPALPPGSLLGRIHLQV